jgi:hypothetical protein
MIISQTNEAIDTKRTRYPRSMPRKDQEVLDRTVTLFDRIQVLTAHRAAALSSSATMRRRRLLEGHAAQGNSLGRARAGRRPVVVLDPQSVVIAPAVAM